ncbi:MAG: acetyl-CoA carboxylase, carboxyltransferase subunit beta [Chloroflexi bacterium]|nr:acetyl-CoA carboxylase, carboxyltransferase subunit beta [Chloroflexota bacterium]
MACPGCGTLVETTATYRRYGVCQHCRHHFPMSAAERLALVVDEGSFQEVNTSLVSLDPLTFADKVPYKERLAQAQERTGLQEAVITGIGKIDGWAAVLAISDFAFLGGSMGSVVGEKVTLALELASRRRLPFIAICSSGGARMQEGMLSLVQMAKTAAAAMRLHRAGVPIISVLTNPTTGGVYASYASQGDILLAEPGALIGFAGPRVIAETTGQPPPAGTHTAEFLLEHGLVDQIVDRARLRGVLATLLHLFHQPSQVSPREREPYRPEPSPPASAWEEVELARHPDRPTSRDYLARLIPLLVELQGDRLYGDDSALIAGLGEIDGLAVVVLAQERGRGEEREARRRGQMRPEGYRKAARTMRLAAQLRLPVVTLIDTPGAALDYEAEARGLAQAISNCLATLSIIPVPVVAAIIGEGGSGGALALGVADRILMQENAIYSVIAPEGASAILYRTSTHAREVASSLKLTAYDCQQLGVVDMVVPEPDGGAHHDPDYAALQLRNHLLPALVELRKVPPRRLVEERYRKFRRMGEHHSYFREAVAQEVDELRRGVGRAFAELRERLPGGQPGERGPSEAG